MMRTMFIAAFSKKTSAGNAELTPWFVSQMDKCRIARIDCFNLANFNKNVNNRFGTQAPVTDVLPMR
jgi:hypothetical protein